MGLRRYLKELEGKVKDREKDVRDLRKLRDEAIKKQKETTY